MKLSSKKAVDSFEPIDINIRVETEDDLLVLIGLFNASINSFNECNRDHERTLEAYRRYVRKGSDSSLWKFFDRIRHERGIEK